MLTQPERREIVVDWNATQAETPIHRCAHQLFASQAALRPDAPAVTFEDQALSYAELDRRANQLAHALHKLGVRNETFVGVVMKRSLEVIVGILGVLKAGGVYLPLEPTYPPDRLASGKN